MTASPHHIPILSRRRFLAAATSVAALPTLHGCVRRDDDAPAANAGPLADDDHPSLIPPELEPRVRILLQRRIRVVRLGAERQWLRLRSRHDHEWGVVVQGPLGIIRNPAGWSIIDHAGTELPSDPGTALRVTSLGDRDEVAVDDQPYPGEMVLFPSSGADDARFDIVNHVPLEAYLPGVLAAELYHHWEPETFAAQAIAARSFACTERAIFQRSRHFDLHASQRSQVYRGSVALDVAREAVEATRGLVIVWNDTDPRLVPGYYSSCCGGAPARAQDAIGPNPINALPPLHGQSHGCVCSDAPLYRWTAERPTTHLARRLRTWARRHDHHDLAALSTLNDVDVAAVNQHGRPLRYRLTDRRGRTAELDAERFRFAANQRVSGLPDPDPRLWSSFVDCRVANGRVTFHGCGHGHGVGLCQYGAQQLARGGMHHEAILRRFYPDAHLHQAYRSTADLVALLG